MAVLIWPKPGAADRLGHFLHQWRSLDHAPGHGIGLALLLKRNASKIQIGVMFGRDQAADPRFRRQGGLR
jgi:hypothetical protein